MAGYLTNGLPQFTGPFTGDERLFLDTTTPGGAYPQLAYVTFTDLVDAIQAQITGGGGTPAWLPDGAVAFADFANGHYYANGAETTAADTVADPSKIVGGTGLVLTNSEPPVQVLGDFASALIALDWTIVIEGYAAFGSEGPPPVAAVGLNYVIGLANDDDSHEIDIRTGAIGEYGTVSRDAPAMVPNDLSAGNHKTAFTYATDHISSSLDGAAVITDTTVAGSPNTVTTATIGSWLPSVETANAVSIKSITIYPAKPDADLPTLSAL